MSKERLSKRQAWRAEKIQEERRRRAERRDERADELSADGLGPEQEGHVASNLGATLIIESGSGAHFRCSPRNNLGALVVGDRVVWQEGRDGVGVVVALLPRANLLARPDAFGNVKPLAANIDQLLVVAAPLPAWQEEIVNQYLIAAESTGITPVIVMNKVDLLSAEQRADLEESLSIYRKLGYATLFASTLQRHGMDELMALLAGRTSVFVGQSGVGKSSLVKTLLPGEEIRVGELSRPTRHGRHTTSASRLYHLPSGGSIIDSPGVREFRLWEMERQQLARGFIEFRPYLGTCQFRDCRHEQEPGCALRRGVEEGAIAPRRLESFRRIAANAEEHARPRY